MDIYENNDVYQMAYRLIDWYTNTAMGNTLFLVCGGSSTAVIARMWGSLPDAFRQQTRITLTDERFGPVGHPDSNWKILQDLGMDLRDSRHVPVLRPNATIEQTTAQWGEELIELLGWADTVVGIFGIGADSHIAGIKPNSPAATETTAPTVGYQAEDFARITISPAVFKQITSAVIYTEGSAKLPALQLLAQSLDPAAYPDQLIKQAQHFQVYYKP